MRSLLAALITLLLPMSVVSAAEPTENDYYKMITLPTPDDVVLEVGGLGWLDKEKTRLLACTRRGELFVIDNVYTDKPTLDNQAAGDPTDVVKYTQMLFGLAEPLGILVNPGHGFKDGIYMAQRGELTRVEDTDGDDRIDVVETINDDWELSGSYHEYAFGPVLGKDGDLWVTLNRPFGGGQEPNGYWRGWAVKIDTEGNMQPVCPGLRSPAGIGKIADGEMFYTDNQGDHVAVCKLSHLKPGVFHGQTTGLESVDHPLSNFKLPFEGYPKRGMYWAEAVEANPHLQAPAVWFPYPEMGKSHSELLLDTTGGKFGPFENQLFIGDQGTAIIVRVCLEKIGGEYQGACFPFRRGFDSGVLRLEWGHDGSLFVGGTNRGWGGGSKPYCLQRLVWTGKTPFEPLEMRAKPDGFEVTFTQPVDPKTAADVASYKLRSWTYRYDGAYGDPPRNTHDLKITNVDVAEDGKSVRLTVDGLEPYYVHELRFDGVRNTDGQGLLHPIGYYTLNRIPAEQSE